MRVYRFCWWGLVLPLAGLGMLVAVLALPLGDAVVRQEEATHPLQGVRHAGDPPAFH